MGAANAREKRRVLVVDDVELNRVLTEAVLRGAAYEVDTVGDGASALRALQDESYDLVLMDLEMPGLGGHDAAAAIRRNKDRPMRVAAISSQSNAAARLRSAEVGMAAHIARPIAPHQLLREIERVFCQPAEEARPDCWQKSMYDEWVSRLGAERMLGFLCTLQDQFRNLLLLVVGQGQTEALHRRAHDVASTAGMLGFAEVTRHCRALLEARDAAIEEDARENLGEELQRAIARLDLHLAQDRSAPAAA